MTGSAKPTRMIQAKGQLSRHHSGPCPRDDAEEPLQILRWAPRLPCKFCFVTLVSAMAMGFVSRLVFGCRSDAKRSRGRRVLTMSGTCGS